MSESKSSASQTHSPLRSTVAAVDTRVKLALLVVSAATIATLVVAGLRENIFADWRQLRKQYASLLVNAASDDRGREAARDFEIRLVQNFVPELGAVDRCVTCHAGVQDPRMADAPQPFALHPGHHLEIHDPDKFGCTVCHLGQGRATETQAAHGRVEFWDHPMLQRDLLASSCTKCHIEADLFGRDGLIERAYGHQLSAPAEAIEKGRVLVRESGCLGCHTMHGKGGAAAPDLSTVGNKTRHDFTFTHLAADEPREVGYWMKAHFLEPVRVSPGSIMPAVNTPEEAEALTAYMLSLRRREVGRYFYAKRLQDTAEAPESGRELFMRYCSACHGPDGKGGRVPAVQALTLNNPATLAVASDDFYRRVITTGRRGTRMPAWGEGAGNLSRHEIEKIVEYIRSWEPAGGTSADILASRGDPDRGKASYGRLCTGCHGEGRDRAIEKALAGTAESAVEAIVEGKRAAGMPSWRQLPAQEVSDLLAYMRRLPSLRTTNEPPHGTPTVTELVLAGQARFGQHCAPCHGPNGRGRADGAAHFAPALNNPDFLAAADDGFLFATVALGRPGTAMIPFAAGNGGGPALPPAVIREIVAFVRSWETPARTGAGAKGSSDRQ